MEKRVTRYSKKNRFKRNLKKLSLNGIIKLMIKFIIKNIIYLMIGLAYSIYLIVKAFDNLIAKFYMKLPRLMKVAIIYILVFNLGQDLYNTFVRNNFKINEISAIKLNINYIPTNLSTEEEKTEECAFDKTSCKISETGKKLGLNEEQILISIAISKWETGNYTSQAFLKRNNVGGMMCSSGLISYSTLEDGILAFVTNLKYNYFDIGLTTLELIQPKYCPIGAKNDPQGLNKNWLTGTNKMYKELTAK